jgi:hypothetical protein
MQKQLSAMSAARKRNKHNRNPVLSPNRRMQSERSTRYASETVVDEGRYNFFDCTHENIEVR